MSVHPSIVFCAQGDPGIASRSTCPKKSRWKCSRDGGARSHEATVRIKKTGDRAATKKSLAVRKTENKAPGLDPTERHFVRLFGQRPATRAQRLPRMHFGMPIASTMVRLGEKEMLAKHSICRLSCRRQALALRNPLLDSEPLDSEALQAPHLFQRVERRLETAINGRRKRMQAGKQGRTPYLLF